MWKSAKIKIHEIPTRVTGTAVFARNLWVCGEVQVKPATGVNSVGMGAGWATPTHFVPCATLLLEYTNIVEFCTSFLKLILDCKGVQHVGWVLRSCLTAQPFRNMLILSKQTENVYMIIFYGKTWLKYYVVLFYSGRERERMMAMKCGGKWEGKRGHSELEMVRERETARQQREWDNKRGQCKRHSENTVREGDGQREMVRDTVKRWQGMWQGHGKGHGILHDTIWSPLDGARKPCFKRIGQNRMKKVRIKNKHKT